MTWFRKCNPFPALLYFVAVTALSAVYNNPYHTAVTLVSAALMFILCGGKKKTAVGFFMIFLLTYIVNPIISKKGATPLIFIGSDPITLEAVVYGLNSASLIAAVLFLFYCFTDMTDSEKLMYMLSPFSASFALTVSAVLRFVPLYVRQANEIAEQQTAMGVQGGKSIPEKVKYGGRIFSALSTWALENGIVTADSMACRGYGTGRRSFYTAYGFKKNDGVFLSCEILLILSVVIPSFFTTCSYNYYPDLVFPTVNAPFIISALSYALLVFLPLMFEVTDRIKWKYLLQKI